MTKASWYIGKEGQADHLVYLDKKAKELSKLLAQTKSMIVRGAAGKKVPLGGRVRVGDWLYFVETGADLIVNYRAQVKRVVETEKLDLEQAKEWLHTFEKQLELSSLQYQRWQEKKFLCFIEVSTLEAISPFRYRREKNMDDWIITKTIDEIKEMTMKGGED